MSDASSGPYAALSAYFDTVAPVREKWIRRNAGYNREILRLVKRHVPEGRRVLEVGCATGHLLAALRPSVGVGVDLSPAMVAEAARRHPDLQFRQGEAESFDSEGTFDHVVMVDTIGFVRDVQAAMENLRRACTNETRVLVTTYSRIWLPALRLLEAIGLKMPQPMSNWLSRQTIENILRLADFEIVEEGRAILLPAAIPLVSRFANRFLAHLPILRHFCQTQYVVARPLHLKPRAEMSVSVIVPARNEAGNIDALIGEIPEMGSRTEIIFVEGHSTDNTWEAIEAAARRHAERRIVCLRQTGKGKGDAVRAGFAAATGDVLIIFDADRTVSGADLPKFYEAIASNRAEFVSGDRFVYPMDENAMRAFNVLGNWFFALVFSTMLGRDIHDTLCGTKALTKRAWERVDRELGLFGRIDPFGDYDLILGAARLDLSFAAIPVRYGSRRYGQTNISRWTDGARLLRICFIAALKLKFI